MTNLCSCLNCQTAIDRASKFVAQQINDDECAIAVMAVAAAHMITAQYVLSIGGYSPKESSDLFVELKKILVEWGVELKNPTFPEINEAIAGYILRQKYEENVLKDN